MSVPQKTNEPPSLKPRRLWLRRCLFLLVGMIVFIACAPWIVTNTPLLNLLLQAATADSQLQISTRGASLGWFSSLQVDGLAVTDLRGGSLMRIDRIGAQKSWLGLVREIPNLGTFTIDRPHVELVTHQFPVAPPPPPSESPPRSGREKPTFRAEVRNVSIIVREKSDQPSVVELDDVDVSVQIVREGEQRVLTVEPTQLLRHQELTADMCHKGLQLIAPILANTANVKGRVSLRLDRLRVGLDPPPNELPQVDVDGHLILHEVSAGLRNPVLIEIAQKVAKMLGRKMPSQVQLADEADVHFYVRDGRVFHEGLAFGLPEVSPDLQIRTHGSVGMDRSLDMFVEVPIPLDLLRDGPLFRMLSERPLQFQVRGTLDKPEMSLPDDRQWYNELAERLLPAVGADGAVAGESNLAAVEPLAEALLETMGEMLERRRQAAAERKAQADEVEPNSAPLLDRLRSFREGRRKRNEPEPETPARPPRPGPVRKGVEL